MFLLAILFAAAYAYPEEPDGSGARPWEIHALEDLQKIAYEKDGWNIGGWHPGDSFVLMNDIDAAETETWNQLVDRGAWAPQTGYEPNDFVTYDNKNYYCTEKHLSEEAFDAGKWQETRLNPGDHLGFRPVGREGRNFNGIFDGRGYTVSGLYINRPDESFQGLFGRTFDSSRIMNLRLEGVRITGGENVGGLVGFSYGRIVHCHVTGRVHGTGRAVGGLVGRKEWFSIVESSADVRVKGEGQWVGGLVGWNLNGPISNSYAAGNVEGQGRVGGLVGQNGAGGHHAWITDSYSTGTVSGGWSVGGLVGQEGGEDAFVRNSFWDTQTSRSGISEGGEGKTTVEMQTLGTYTDSGGLGVQQSGAVTVAADSTSVGGTDTAFTAEFGPGALIRVGYEVRVIDSIVDDTELSVTTAFDSSHEAEDIFLVSEDGAGEQMSGAVNFPSGIPVGFSLRAAEDSNPAFTREFHSGALIRLGDEIREIDIILNYNQMTVTEAFNSSYSEEDIFLLTEDDGNWDIVANFDRSRTWGLVEGINDGYPFLQALVEVPESDAE